MGAVRTGAAVGINPPNMELKSLPTPPKMEERGSPGREREGSASEGSAVGKADRREQMSEVAPARIDETCGLAPTWPRSALALHGSSFKMDESEEGMLIGAVSTGAAVGITPPRMELKSLPTPPRMEERGRVGRASEGRVSEGSAVGRLDKREQISEVAPARIEETCGFAPTWPRSALALHGSPFKIDESEEGMLMGAVSTGVAVGINPFKPEDNPGRIPPKMLERGRAGKLGVGKGSERSFKIELRGSPGTDNTGGWVGNASALAKAVRR